MRVITDRETGRLRVVSGYTLDGIFLPDTAKPRYDLGHTAYNHLGADEFRGPGLVALLAMGAAAYHGYKRNNSVGWALGWGLLAGINWPITVGVAAAQGFAKRKGH